MKSSQGIFISLPLCFNTKLTWNEKIILSEINRLNDCNIKQIPNQYLANFIHQSISTIHRIIRKLIKLDLIKSEDFNGRIRCLRRVTHDTADVSPMTQQMCQNDTWVEKYPRILFNAPIYNNNYNNILNINNNNQTRNNLTRNLNRKNKPKKDMGQIEIKLEEKKIERLLREKEKKKKEKKEDYISENFSLNEKMISFAKERNTDPESEFECFKNYHIAKGNKFKNWEAAFRTWILNTCRWRKSSQNGSSFAPASDSPWVPEYMRTNLSEEYRRRKQEAPLFMSVFKTNEDDSGSIIEVPLRVM